MLIVRAVLSAISFCYAILEVIAMACIVIVAGVIVLISVIGVLHFIAAFLEILFVVATKYIV